MTIYLAADHAGFELKEVVKKHLEKQKHNVVDCGAFALDAEDDYPDYMSKAAELVSRRTDVRGFLFGGSGQGEAMVANRFEGVRCAVFYGARAPKTAIDAEGHASTDPLTIVRLEREHNNANMLALGARFVDNKEAFQAIDLFLEVDFSNADRHIRRIKKF